MSSKLSDHFHLSLVSQYRDLIHEAIIESEIDHKSHLDLVLLAQKIHTIMQAAAIDGIPSSEIEELLDEARRFETRELKVV